MGDLVENSGVLVTFDLLAVNRENCYYIYTLVLTLIQFDVSLSSSHFLNHNSKYLHKIGRWGSRPQRKLEKRVIKYFKLVKQ